MAFAPGRVNLIGEHTDYNDGLVLPMPIALGVTATLAWRDDRAVRARSGSQASPESYVLGEEAKRGTWIDYVMACTHVFRVARGFDLELESTLPMGAGLASSAALTTAVLRALGCPEEELADRSHAAEAGFVGVPIGRMDNVVCAYGKARRALFFDVRSDERRIVALPETVTIAIAHSGVTHTNATSGYATRRAECEEAARLLGVPTLREATLDSLHRLPDVPRRRARHVVTENARVLESVDALERGDLRRLGALLDASHASQRDDYECSVPAVDRLVDALRAEAGVLGARLTGGGFGGAVIALVERGREDAVGRALARCPGSFPLG